MTTDSTNTNKRRILLAEDNPENQRVAERMLKKLDFEVISVWDGMEALAATAEESFDLIMMDLHMPRMDGFETARLIRAKEGPSRTAIIVALTANMRPGIREECIQYGMNDYLSKPVSLQQLRNTLTYWLEGRSSSQEILSHIQQTSLKSGERAEDMLKNILIGLSLELKALKEAQKNGELSAIKSHAQILKGSSETIGARRINALCQRLEEMGRSGILEGAKSMVEEIEKEISQINRSLNS